MNFISVNNLSYRYPDGTQALNNISLYVRKNIKLALLGANGSGKTTLMLHLNGLMLAQSGNIEVFDQTIGKHNLKNIRSKVGILFDNPDNQLFSTTVYDDVAFGPYNMGCSEGEIKSRVKSALEKVKISHLADKPPHNLSLGQKKKAAIAGLLAMSLEVFVMDEPFSGLDPASVTEFLGILQDLHKDGATMIISTHDVDLAYVWADEVAIMSQGNIVAYGDTSILHSKELVDKWNLRLPILAETFMDTQYAPRAPDEARVIVNSLDCCKEIKPDKGG